MPVISAFADHPTHPYVRVEVNWADTPSVDYARVLRVNADGSCTPLRPYICYDGDHLLLSCGMGVFWDTEAPFGEDFYYISEGLDAPCVPQSVLAYTRFDTPLVNSWGSTEGGTLGPLPWALSGGTVPGNYDVAGGAGLHTLDSVNVFRFSTIDIGSSDFDIYYSVSSPVTATGAPISTRAVGRFTDPNNTYFGGVQFEITGVTSVQIAKIVGGSGALITQSLDGAYVPGQVYHSRFKGTGLRLQAKIWADGSPEPEAWTIDTMDTVGAPPPDTGTRVGLVSRLNSGNTNGTTTVSYQYFEVINECLPCEPATAGPTGTLTLEPDGRFWLKDPVRPCHDRPVVLCPTGAPAPTVCDGPSGILFIGSGPEVYGDNSFGLRPQNRRRILQATRPRGDAASALRLETVTFDDRDAVLELTAPGSPLLWQGPAEYGIPDRYLGVGPVQVAPVLPDLRVQNRNITLPYDTVERPAGPTQGICGARVADICELYPTWDDLAATGLTWNDLVAGMASPESASTSRRTWNDVNADFASWDAVNSDGRTWDGLEGGL